MSERISPNVPPSNPRRGLTSRGREDEGTERDRERERERERERGREGEEGRSKGDKEITCEHMALTAYEMYNYYLQLVRRSVVAKNSRQ